MSMSETSVNSFEKKVETITLLPSMSKDREWLSAFVKAWDISVPMAMAVHLGYVTELSDRGTEEIERCFTALAETLGKTEQELLADIE